MWIGLQLKHYKPEIIDFKHYKPEIIDFKHNHFLGCFGALEGALEIL